MATEVIPCNHSTESRWNLARCMPAHSPCLALPTLCSPRAAKNSGANNCAQRRGDPRAGGSAQHQGGSASRLPPRAYEPRTRYSAVPLKKGKNGHCRVPCRVGWHRTSAGCPSPEPRATAHLQGAPNLHVNDKGTAGAATRAASRGARGLGVLQARRLAAPSCRTHQHAARLLAACAMLLPGSNKCANHAGQCSQSTAPCSRHTAASGEGPNTCKNAAFPATHAGPCNAAA